MMKAEDEESKKLVAFIDRLHPYDPHIRAVYRGIYGSEPCCGWFGMLSEIVRQAQNPKSPHHQAAKDGLRYIVGLPPIH